MKTVTIDQTIGYLAIALNKIVNFESKSESDDFILDVLNEYKLIIKQMEEVDKFLEELDLKRKETQKQFDELVIKRFIEMVEESSSPEMFENLIEDIKILKKTRGLIK
jgi:hypothetical protein